MSQSLGLSLQLENFDVFKTQAENVTSLFGVMGEAATTAAQKLNSIQLGTLNFDTKSLDKLKPSELTQKANALVEIGKAYQQVVDSLSKANPTLLAEFNKALSGGAQAGTITAKATAYTQLSTALTQVVAIPKLDSTAKNLKDIGTVLQGSFNVSGFKDLPAASLALTEFSAAVGKFASSKKFQTSFQMLGPITDALNKFATIPFGSVISVMPGFASGLTLVSTAIRSFVNSKNIADLPNTLKAAIDAIERLISVWKKLSQDLGNAGLAKFSNEMKIFSGSLSALSTSIRSFSQIQKFTDAVKGIELAFTALTNIQSKLNSGTAYSASTITTLTQMGTAIKGLGDSFSRLSRLKGLNDFPTIIQNINNGLKSLDVSNLETLAQKISAVSVPLQKLSDVAQSLKGVRGLDTIKRSMSEAAAPVSSLTQLLTTTITVLRTMMNVLVTITPIVVNFLRSFAGFSVQALVVAFNTLKTVFVTIPFNVVTTGFKLISTAINVLVGAVKLLFAPLFAFRDLLVHIDKQQRLNARAFGVLMQPVTALIKVIQGLVAVFTTLFNIGSRIAGVFNPFKKSVDDAGAAATKASESLKKVNTEANNVKPDATKVQKLNQELTKVDSASASASNGMRNFNQSVNVSNLDGAVNSLSRLAVTMRAMEVVGGAVSAIFNRFGNDVKNLITSAFTAATEFESMRNNLNVLVGVEKMNLNPGMFENALEASRSVGAEVDALLGRFQMLALQSPFNRSDIADGFRMAKVYGFTTDQSERMTNVITETAAALNLQGYAIKDLILPLGQMNTLGKVQLQDAKQLATRGIDVFRIWADALSTVGNTVTQADILGMITEGELTSDFGISTIIDSLEKQWTGAAKAANETTAGLIAAFEELRGEVARSMFTPIIEELKPFAVAYLSMENMQEMMGKARERGEHLAAVFRGFVVPTIKTFLSIIDSIPAPIKNIIGLLGQWIGITLAISAALGAAKLAIGAVALVLSVLISPIVLATGAIVAFTALVIANFNDIKRVATAVGASIMAVPNAIQQAFSGGAETGNPLDAILAPFNNLTDIKERIGYPFKVALDFVVAQFANLGTQISVLLNNLGGSFSGDGIFSGLVGEITKLPELLNTTMSTVTSNFTTLLDLFVSFGANIISSFSGGIVDTYDILTRAILGIGELLTFWLAPGSPPRVAPDIDKYGESAALEFVDGFSEAFANGVKTVMAALSGITVAELSKFTDMLIAPFVAIGSAITVLLIGTLINTGKLIATTLAGVFQVIVAVIQGFGMQIAIPFVTLFDIAESLKGPISVIDFFTNVIRGLEKGASLSLLAFGQTFYDVFSGITRIVGGFAQFLNSEILTGFTALSFFSDTIKNNLGDMNFGSAGLSDGIEEGLAYARDLFSDFLVDAVTFGQNVVTQFADGVVQGIGYLISSIQRIGGVIIEWLAPGSPPKVAPDIDKYGESAALEFVNGFANGFSISFASAMDKIRNLTVADIQSLIGIITAPFVALASAIGTLVFGTLINSIGLIINLIDGIFTALRSISGGILRQIVIIIEAIIGLVDVFRMPGTAFEKFQGVVDVVTTAIIATIGSLAQSIFDVFSGVMSIIGAVIAFINGEALVGFMALSHFSEYIRNSLQEIAKGSRDFLGGVTDALRFAEDEFARVLDNVTEYGANIVVQFADGIIDTVSLVAEALAFIGREIEYWLAPGSPPRIAPDIDKWGTSAAQEFLDGFTKADLDIISDFGSSIQNILGTLEIEDVDVKRIVEQFTSGFDTLNKTGEFDTDSFSRIIELSNDAGDEISILTERYIGLISEQSELNRLTSEYDAELKAAKGTLDSLGNTESLETNSKKIESLNNALTNTLITQEERTRIQRQIEKLQAENRIKQLESQKSAQEENVNSAKEALDLQKKQLSLADSFDPRAGAFAGGMAGGSSAEKANNKAATAAERLAKAQLDYRLQAADTAGKIKILREELAKTTEGSEEYYEILTDIDRLEKQLSREREAEAKRLEKANKDAEDGVSRTAGYGPVAGAGAGIADTVEDAKDRIEKMSTEIGKSFTRIKDTITDAWNNVKEFLDDWVLKNNAVKASLLALGTVIVSIKLVGFLTTLKTALALLTTPLGATVLLVSGAAAAFTYFSSQAGGLNGVLDNIGKTVTSFQSGFGVGTESKIPFMESVIDLSSVDSFAISFGAALGRVTTQINTQVSQFLTDLTDGALGEDFNFANIFNLDATAFDGTVSGFVGEVIGIIGRAIQTIVYTTLASFGGLSVENQQIIDTIYDNVFKPIEDAFATSDTILGGLTTGITGSISGIGKLISDSFSTLFEGDVKEKIDTLFAENDIAGTINENLNEVATSIAGEESGFDFATVFADISVQVKAAGTTIQETWQTITGLFTGDGALSHILEINRAAFEEFFNELTSPEMISALTSIGQLLAGIGAILALAFNAALLAIMTNITDLIIEVGNGLGTIYEGVGQMIDGDIFGGLVTILQGTFAIVEGVFGNIADAIADTVINFLELIGIDTSGFAWMIQLGSDILVSFLSVRTAISTVSSLLASLSARAGTSGSFIVAAFVKLVTELPALLTSFVISTKESILTFFTELPTTFNTIKDNIIAFFMELPGNVSYGIVFSVTSIAYALKTAFSNAFSGLFGGGATDDFLAGMTGDEQVATSGISMNLVQGLFDGIKSALTGYSMSDIFTIFKTKFDELIASFQSSPIVATITDFFSFSTAQEGLETLKTTVQTGITNVRDTITKVDVAVSDFFNLDETALTTLGNLLKPITDAFNEFVNLGAVPDYFMTSVKAIFDLFTGQATIGETIKTIVDSLTKVVNLKGIGEAYIEGLRSVFTLLADNPLVGSLLTTITNALTSLGAMVGIPEGLLESLALLFESVTENQIVGATLEILSASLTAIGEMKFDPALLIENLGSLFTSLSGAGSLGEALNIIKKTLEEFTGLDFSNYATVFKPVTDVFDNLVGKVQAVIDSFNNVQIALGFKEDTTSLTETQQRIRQALESNELTVDQKIDFVANEANIDVQTKKLLDTFLASYEKNTALGGYGATDFAQINQDLIDAGFEAADIETLAMALGKEVPAGIAEGMTSDKTTTTRASRQIASDVLLELASAFGIQSPSEEAKTQIGIPIVQGIALGLLDTTSIDIAITLLSENILAKIESAFGAEGTFNIVTSLLSFDETLLETALVSLDTFVETHIEQFLATYESATTFSDDTTKLFSEFYTNIINITNTFISTITNLFDDFFETLLDMADDFVDDFVDIFEELIPKVQTVMNNLLTTVRGFITPFGNAGTEIGRAFVNGLANAIKDNASLVVTELNNLLANFTATTTLTGVRNAGIKIGEEIIAGIVDGMTSETSSSKIKKAVEDIAKSIIKQFEQSLQIESPSKVARDSIGRYISLGIAEGMLAEENAIANSISNLSTTINEQMDTDVGQFMVAGIVAGIQGQRNVLFNEINNLLNDSVAQARATLQIQSPSKVAYNNIGMPYVDGIASALRDGSGQLGDLASGLLNTKNSEMPIDLYYNNMLSTLPTLTQDVTLSRNKMRKEIRANAPILEKITSSMVSAYSEKVLSQKDVINEHARNLAVPYREQRLEALATTSAMNDNRVHNTTNQSNEYHMHMTVNERNAAKVSNNFNAMRVGRRIRN